MRCGWVIAWLLVLGAHRAAAQEPATAQPSEPEPRRLSLRVHVATGPNGPVVPPGFLAGATAAANRVFGQYGVQFQALGTTPLASRHLRMETRADRDALGAYVRPGAIDCFVVESLRDVDEPDRMRRGVHWRSQTHPGTRYVIVSAIAGEYVLAHELGHYLGNPRHSDVPGNLMSYSLTGSVPFLDAAQLTRLRRALRRVH